MIPCVLHETCNGLSRISIPDIMFKQNREIFCVGEINQELVHELVLQVMYLQSENDKEITIYINSPGGEVQSGLALYDVMQAVSCPIRTVCVGRAASMAALLFIAGDQRYMLPHSRIMIHDPLTLGIDGSALSVDAAARDLMKTRETAAKIIAKHSKHTLDEVYAKTAQNSYFDADEAIAWGLADRIIDKLDKGGIA